MKVLMMINRAYLRVENTIYKKQYVDAHFKLDI